LALILGERRPHLDLRFVAVAEFDQWRGRDTVNEAGDSTTPETASAGRRPTNIRPTVDLQRNACTPRRG
jgi:hypothetical protein